MSRQKSGPRLGIEGHRNTTTATTPYDEWVAYCKTFQSKAVREILRAPNLGELEFLMGFWSFLQGFVPANDDPGANLDELARAYTRRYLELVERGVRT